MSESRERLIAAATELFFGGGFHNVGIAEICDVGRVNKGTFYHFFPSKLDLLIEVIDLYVNDIAAKYRRIPNNPARVTVSIGFSISGGMRHCCPPVVVTRRCGPSSW